MQKVKKTQGTGICNTEICLYLCICIRLVVLECGLRLFLLDLYLAVQRLTSLMRSAAVCVPLRPEQISYLRAT